MTGPAPEQTVMILAPLGQDARVMADLLQTEGITARICAGPEECSQEITGGAGALLLTEEALEMQGSTTLLRALESQPAWSELPLIVLTSGGEARLMGLFETAAQVAENMTLLERPMSPATLLRSVQVALRSRGRQYQVRELLAEQSRQQQRLRESEQRYRLLFDRNPDGVFVVDPAGRFSVVNAACEKLSGYSRTELLGMAFVDLCAPDQVAHTALRFQQNLQTPGYTEIETAFIRKDGARVEVWIAGEPILTNKAVVAVHCTAKDITRRKAAEEALRRSEARLALALEGGQMGMWEWDLRDNSTVWNAREYELLGLPPGDQAPNASLFFERVHPDDVAGLKQSLRDSMASREDWHHEFRIVRSDGEIRWLAGTGRVALGPEGNPERMVGLNYDITERKEFQAELERLVTERTAKLKELVGELEHFSYTITHDMRAPLRSMRGFAELLEELCSPAEELERRPLIRRIITSAERMDLLITDALSYSQAVRQHLPLGPVGVGALLRGMIDSYPEFQSVKARIEVSSDMPLVMGNQAGLTQCFSNLLGNAVKFAKPGQTPEIRIRAEWSGGSAAPQVAGELNHAPSRWVRIWVEDAGVGISPSMLPRVFDMFARGGTDKPGTGIGLALVRKVVDRMGGRVGVESESGKGSRFWIELLPGDPREPMPSAIPSPPRPPGDIL